MNGLASCFRGSKYMSAVHRESSHIPGTNSRSIMCMGGSI